MTVPSPILGLLGRPTVTFFAPTSAPAAISDASVARNAFLPSAAESARKVRLAAAASASTLRSWTTETRLDRPTRAPATESSRS